MNAFAPDTRPALPQDLHRFGIGLIGFGGIAEYAHVPAYRKAGLRLAAVASRSAASLARARAVCGPDIVHDDWRTLLDLPAVDIVDVTVPSDEDRLDIVAQASARGKHILMQKPMAHSRAAAREMVRLAETAGVKLAVNQNARWCPVYRGARAAVEQGLLGDVCFLIHDMQNNQDSAPWFRGKWYARQPRFQLMEYAVHHLDLMRYWTGLEPLDVKASIGRKTTQHTRGEVIASVQMLFPGGALGVVVENNAGATSEVYSRFRIEGSLGMACGTAMGTAGLEVQSTALPPGRHALPARADWFPDGFIGTMGELQRALEEAREPSISGRDNLQTLEIVFRAYESAGG